MGLIEEDTGFLAYSSSPEKPNRRFLKEARGQDMRPTP